VVIAGAFGCPASAFCNAPHRRGVEFLLGHLRRIHNNRGLLVRQLDQTHTFTTASFRGAVAAAFSGLIGSLHLVLVGFGYLRVPSVLVNLRLDFDIIVIVVVVIIGGGGDVVVVLVSLRLDFDIIVIVIVVISGGGGGGVVVGLRLVFDVVAVVLLLVFVIVVVIVVFVFIVAPFFVFLCTL